jgi:hypothetical protein
LTQAPPTPQVGEEPRGHEYVWLAFFAALGVRPAIEHATVEVDQGKALGRLQRGRQQGVFPSGAVERGDEKARYVLSRTTPSAMSFLNLSIPPCRPDQSSRLAARQPTIAVVAFLRQNDLDDRRA